ncbi:hypothetical protein D3C85_1898030 [compost metagenome]
MVKLPTRFRKEADRTATSFIRVEVGISALAPELSKSAVCAIAFSGRAIQPAKNQPIIPKITAAAIPLRMINC